MNTFVLLSLGLIVLANSTLKAGRIFHPYSLFAACWVVAGPFAGALEFERLSKYDFNELSCAVLIFCAVWFGSSMAFSKRKVVPIDISEKVLKGSLNDRGPKILIAAMVGLVLLEFGRQLLSCHLSIDRWWDYSTGPRFGRPWKLGRLGGNDFMQRLWMAVAICSGPALGAIAPFARGRLRWVAWGALGFQLILLILDGSRTPFIASIGAVFLSNLIISSKSSQIRLLALTGLVVTAIILCNAMVTTRSTGFEFRTDQSTISLPKLDDNSVRMLHIIRKDNTGSAIHLDPLPFMKMSFLGVVPRYLWPDKPTLTQSYFGTWRLYYTTVFFGGELISMFGLILSLPLAAGLSFLLQNFLNYAYRRATHPAGVALFFFSLLACYMVCRSLLNFSIFLVPVVTIWILVLLIEYTDKQKACVSA